MNYREGRLISGFQRAHFPLLDIAQEVRLHGDTRMTSLTFIEFHINTYERILFDALSITEEVDCQW